MIYVIETIEAISGNAEQLKAALLKLVPLSRQETGCVSYQLFQEPDHAHRFAVFMCWIDAQAYENHNEAPFIQEFIKKFGSHAYHNVVETLYEKLS